jgi:hypothetical protein
VVFFENLRLASDENPPTFTVDLERQGPLEEAATSAIASGFQKCHFIEDLKLVYWRD